MRSGPVGWMRAVAGQIIFLLTVLTPYFIRKKIFFYLARVAARGQKNRGKQVGLCFFLLINLQSEALCKISLKILATPHIGDSPTAKKRALGADRRS